MSQLEWMRGFDAMAFAAFRGAGLGDAGSYLSPAALADLRAIAGHDPDDPDAPPPPPTPVPVACTVLVDRDVEDFAESGAVVSTLRTKVTFQREELTPEQGGELAIGPERFVLVQRVRADESASAWWVQHA